MQMFFLWRWLSSVFPLRVILQKNTNVSEVPAASIFLLQSIKKYLIKIKNEMSKYNDE